METYKPYSVIVVPFPFTDSSKIKRRPALVLSSEDYQQHTGHITLLMITSAKNAEWYGDYEITDLKAAGLDAPSVIRQKIFTLDSRLVLDCVGKLSVTDREGVSKITVRHLRVLGH